MIGNNQYKYLVGVRCFTFNQSKYILDALNGFVMQQTNFPYVVMVVDDASTDGEQEVIRKFVDEQFDTNDTSVAYEKETDYAIVTYAQHKVNKNCYFAVLYLKENHYSQRKSKFPYLSEWRDNVKYEALCEGDDYWIHPQKLQMQVDFLEENEEYGLVYGKAKHLMQESSSYINIGGRKISGFEDLLLNYGIGTLTVMYRKCSADGYDNFVKEERKRSHWLMGDLPLWLFITVKYKVYFIDEIFAVYRVLEESASHSKSYEKQRDFIKSSWDVRCFFADSFGRKDLKMIIDELHAHKIFYLAILYNRKDDAKKYIKIIRKTSFKEKLMYILFVVLPFRYSIKK